MHFIYLIQSISEKNVHAVGNLTLRMWDGKILEYKVHELIEFDSDRKRMSVIVENKYTFFLGCTSPAQNKVIYMQK